MHGGIRFAQRRGVGASSEHSMACQPGTDGRSGVCVSPRAVRSATRAFRCRACPVAETRTSNEQVKVGEKYEEAMATMRLCRIECRLDGVKVGRSRFDGGAVCGSG
jgi:hypothetical protein